MQTRLALLGGVFLLTAAAACPATGPGPAQPTAAAVPASTPVPTAPDPRALYEGFAPEHPWRAVLARVGRWKLERDGEWQEPIEGAQSWAPFDLLVADTAGDEVRVVAEREDLLYAVWIPRDDLAVVPVQTTTLAAAPGGATAADEPGVQLAGGAPIEVLERQNGWAHVRTTAPEVQAEGWMPEVLLGSMYRADPFPVADETIDLEPAVGLEVRSSSVGGVLAVLRPDASQRVRVRALGEASLGWREIRYPSTSVVVRGFVRADGLTAASAEHPEAPSHTVSTYHAHGDLKWLQVPIATEVLVTPEGDAFAVTTAGTKLVVDTDHAAHRTGVTVRTIWGDAAGWVKCDPVPAGMAQPLLDQCVAPFEE